MNIASSDDHGGYFSGSAIPGADRRQSRKLVASFRIASEGGTIYAGRFPSRLRLILTLARRPAASCRARFHHLRSLTAIPALRAGPALKIGGDPGDRQDEAAAFGARRPR